MMTYITPSGKYDKTHRSTNYSNSKSRKIILPKNEEKIEANVLLQYRESMKSDISKRLKMNAPTAKYDITTKRAYLEYPDGKKVYADET